MRNIRTLTVAVFVLGLWSTHGADRQPPPEIVGGISSMKREGTNVTKLSVTLTNKTSTPFKLSGFSLRNVLVATRLQGTNQTFGFARPREFLDPPPPSVDYQINLPAFGTNKFETALPAIVRVHTGQEVVVSNALKVMYQMDRQASAINLKTGKPMMIRVVGAGEVSVK